MKHESCSSGKARFHSESSASRRINKYRDIKRVYYCSECGGFHLTSQEHVREEFKKPEERIPTKKDIKNRIKYLIKSKTERQ